MEGPMPGEMEEGLDRESTLADKMFELLTEEIVSGALPPGSKISEPELARRHGVSRGPLREALRRLQERKLVTRSPRFGARVAEMSAETFAEIFTIREALECIAAREAAIHITKEEVAHLRSLVLAREGQLAASDTALYPQGPEDEDFHFAIARFSRNRLLISLLCDEYYQLLRLYRLRHGGEARRARRALVEHSRLVDALADGDGELAELLMRRHITATRKSMEEHVVAGQEAAAAIAKKPRARRRAK